MFTWFYQDFACLGQVNAWFYQAKMSNLGLLFLSELRAEVLCRLYGPNRKKFYLSQLVAETKYVSRSIEEELTKLKTLELIVATRDGNRVYYTANEQHPLFPDLRNIVMKSTGLRDILASALPNDSIQVAFVFGSIAQGTERAESDIDLMVIGSISNLELASRLGAIADQVGRVINPHVFDSSEIEERLARRDHFLTSVINQPKLFVIGNEHNLGDLVKGWLDPASSNQS